MPTPPVTRVARPLFRGRAMRMLRLASLAGGVISILLPAALLTSSAHGVPPELRPYIVLVGLALASTGFFTVALAGHRMARKPLLRSFAALMLLPPFGASGVVIWHASDLLLSLLCGFLLLLSMLLYLSFVQPLQHAPQARPRRRRRARGPLWWRKLRQRRGHPAARPVPVAANQPVVSRKSDSGG